MSKIKLFENKKIRTIWNDAEEKWYFVVEDVVAVLTDSNDPKQYIKRLRQRDEELAKGWVQFVPTLTVETAGGKQRMNCANTQGIFRIIQSIPSPKAEPFKRWLAQVGSERFEEIENPELAMQRTRENRQSARQGGKIAGDARKALELKTGESVVSKENFLPTTKPIKRLIK